jgi:gluconate kinase
MNKIFFITGVNGVGKSTIIPHLKNILSGDEFAVHDFDSRGVPDNADNAWRISETKYWISEGNRLSKEGKNIVICGFIKPSDLGEYDLLSPGLPEVALIMLYAKPEIIQQRLIGRYTQNGVFDESQKVIGKPVNEFIAGNVWFVEKMNKEFKEYKLPIIDTSQLAPAEVAKKSAEIIIEKLKNE